MDTKQMASPGRGLFSSAIVLAAGSGSRMGKGNGLPKQFMELLGQPMLAYSLRAFQESGVSEIVLVTSEPYTAYCREEIAEKYGFSKISGIAIGGATRTESVYRGLLETTGEVVLVHDGARPVLTCQLVEKLQEAAVQYGAAVAAVPVKDTIKEADAEGFVSATPDRERLWSVQTPQAFSRELLVQAYQRYWQTPEPERRKLTDDASLVEAYGGAKVRLVPAYYENIKVTTPEDPEIVEIFLKKCLTAEK